MLTNEERENAAKIIRAIKAEYQFSYDEMAQFKNFERLGYVETNNSEGRWYYYMSRKTIERMAKAQKGVSVELYDKFFAAYGIDKKQISQELSDEKCKEIVKDAKEKIDYLNNPTLEIMPTGPKTKQADLFFIELINKHSKISKKLGSLLLSFNVTEEFEDNIRKINESASIYYNVASSIHKERPVVAIQNYDQIINTLETSKDKKLLATLYSNRGAL